MIENINSREIDQALFFAIEKKIYKDVVEFVKQGANIEARNKYNNTPLHEAVYTSDEAIVSLLLDNGADVKAIGYEGRQPLLRATQRKNESIVILLLNKGANINCRDEKGMTPLHLTCYENYTPLAHLFLEHGADIEAKDNYGRTPLHLAAEQDALEAIIVLLQAKADIEAKDNYGRTPLHVAASSDALNAMRYLFGLGANIEAQDIKARTPLHLAHREGASHAMNLLISLGANTNAKDGNDNTPQMVSHQHRLYKKGKRKEILENQKNKTKMYDNLQEIGLFKESKKALNNRNENKILQPNLNKALQAYLIKQARSINDEAINHYKIENYNEAKNGFERALELFLLVEQESKMDRAHLYLDLGLTYRNLDKYCKANKHIVFAINLRRDLYGDIHSKTVEAKTELDECKRYFKSKKKLEQSALLKL